MERYKPTKAEVEIIEGAIEEVVKQWCDDIASENIDLFLDEAEVQEDSCHYWQGGPERFVQVTSVSDYTQELNDFIQDVFEVANDILKVNDALEDYVKDELCESLYMAFDEEVFGSWSDLVTKANDKYHQFLVIDDGYIYAVRVLTDDQYRELAGQKPLDPGQTRMEV